MDLHTDDLARHIYLRQVQERSRIIFYRYLLENIDEVLPIVYTPTVGEACQQFSRIFRIPHGLFVSYPDVARIDHMIANYGAERIQVVVVTDGERILGLGDQGVGGMGIPTGKLALYTACGGLHPRRSLPVLLDVGTNNEDLLNDPLYMGWRHQRITGDDYYDFVERFVDAISRHYPGVMLQWEDFAAHNSMPLLEKYRHRVPSFNDDIQGTAAVTLATLISGANHTGTRLRDQRIVIAGAGGAGCGIADEIVRYATRDGMSVEEARARIFMVDRDGLIHDRMSGLSSHQACYAQTTEGVGSWSNGGQISLLDTVRGANPDVLIGVSAQPGLFTPEVIRSMAAGTPRPIVLPLSNPTSRIEASPGDILSWTEGRALVATGSPYPGVSQTNNVYAFPGIGLGAVAAGVTEITDRMLMATSAAVARCAPGDALLPRLTDIRDVSFAVATAVVTTALEEGVATVTTDDPEALVRSHMWDPEYPTFTAGL